MSAYANKITQCEQLLDYQFMNKLLCLEALQTSGNPLVWANQYRVIRKNENLAVLGDVLMKAHLCRRWYSSGRTKGNEQIKAAATSARLTFLGQWTVAEQAIISNNNLSIVGFTIGLDACVILNPGTVTVSDKTMATTVEALVGATFCDGGEDALAKLLDTLGLDHEYLTSVTLTIHFLSQRTGATHAVLANNVSRP